MKVVERRDDGLTVSMSWAEMREVWLGMLFGEKPLGPTQGQRDFEDIYLQVDYESMTPLPQDDIKREDKK